MSQSTKGKTNPHLLPLQEQWINMSVKEIASQIECTENTVRGKLRYASNNLQKYIENLGDNGLKLRCIGILPFLYAIFNVERASITATPSAQALASIAQISGNVANSAVANSAVVNSAVANSAVNSAVVNSAVVTTAATASKASILPFVLIGSGIAATVTAAVVAAVVIVGGKDTDDKNMSFTSKVTISQESSDIVENNSDDNTIDSTDETTDSATDDSTEAVDTGNSETDFVHYNIDNVFEPIMWGKYLFYYDILVLYKDDGGKSHEKNRQRSFVHSRKGE